MKVLSGFLDGPPPSIGLWLVRFRPGGSTHLHNVTQYWIDYWSPKWKYRGLAFDPSKAWYEGQDIGINDRVLYDVYTVGVPATEYRDG